MVDSIDKSPLTAIGEFLKLESAAGLLLVIAGVLAMVAANSPAGLSLTDLLEPIPLGIFTGSLLSAAAGLLVLNFALPSAPAREPGTRAVPAPAKAGSR
jgi:Na+/H+ antiporter NhaA